MALYLLRSVSLRRAGGGAMQYGTFTASTGSVHTCLRNRSR